LAVPVTDAELLLVALVDLVPGEAETGARYEDEVLSLLPRHGGTLERRLTTGDTEIQVIAFAAREGYASFMADPDRLAIRARYGAAAPTARVLEVTER
jgi:hypothetical protein